MIRRPPRSTPFPTRRSSDLCAESGSGGRLSRCSGRAPPPGGGARPEHRDNLDRKSTRLNSSHDQISYAVFCLKKKNEKITTRAHPAFFINISEYRTPPSSSP